MGVSESRGRTCGPSVEMGPEHSCSQGCEATHVRATLQAEMEGLLASNKEWAASRVSEDPRFFKRLVNTRRPNWMWIGCADSRVPANELLGLPAGEVFVQRNVGNLSSHKDFNCMACLEFAVDVLKVKHIIVCGHYSCGAVRAALSVPCHAPGLVNLWLQDIRSICDEHAAELVQLQDSEAVVDRVVELNVARQVYNVCTSPVVQRAWDAGAQLTVHGLVYQLSDGVLRELTPPIASLDDLDRHSLSSQGAGSRSLGLQQPQQADHVRQDETPSQQGEAPQQQQAEAPLQQGEHTEQQHKQEPSEAGELPAPHGRSEQHLGMQGELPALQGQLEEQRQWQQQEEARSFAQRPALAECSSCQPACDAQWAARAAC